MQRRIIAHPRHEIGIAAEHETAGIMDRGSPGDGAAAPIVAVLVIFFIVAASGAAVYSWATKFKPEGARAPALSFVASSDGCATGLLVAGVAEPILLQRLIVQPAVSRDDYAITMGGRTAASVPWSDPTSARTIVGGDRVRVWLPNTSADVLFIDGPSNSVVARIPVSRAPDDVTPPSLSPVPLSLFRSTVSLRGNVSDACSGIKGVDVSIHDETTRLNWTDAGFSVAPAVDLPASLASGASGEAEWALLVEGVPFELGRVYTFVIDAFDFAGNTARATLSGMSSLVPVRYSEDLLPDTFAPAFFSEARMGGPDT